MKMLLVVVGGIYALALCGWLVLGGIMNTPPGFFSGVATGLVAQFIVATLVGRNL